MDGTALAINRAAIHIEEGELPQARLVLEALEQKGTVSNPLFYYHRALIAWKENRYEEVTQILQDRKFRQAEPYLLLAAAYEKLGKIHEATTALQSSLLCAKGLKRSQIERMLLSRPQSSMD